MRLKKKAFTSVALACALGVGGAGVVQATESPSPSNGNGNGVPGDGEGPSGLPLGFTVQPLGGEQTIELSEVPAQVLHTADQANGEGELTRAQVDFDDIQTVYELTGETEGGEPIEFDVRADGTLEEIEEVIGGDDVPSEVSSLLTEAFPGFTIENRERSTRPTTIGLLRVFYEFDGTDARGRELDVEINQRGTVYTVEPASRQREAPGTEVPGDGDTGDSPGSGGGSGSGSGA